MAKEPDDQKSAEASFEEPSQTFYKTKRNLIVYVGLLLLAVFAGFKLVDSDNKISVLPFRLENPEFLSGILFVVVLFNLFQFFLHWSSQTARVQQNRFYRIDFISTTTISIIAVVCYLVASFWPLLRFPDLSELTSLSSIIGLLVATFGMVIATVVASRYLATGVEAAGRVLKSQSFSQDKVLEEILKSEEWVLVFNPDKTDGYKKISFRDNGNIGLGRNENEDSWGVTGGLLEIFNNKGRVFSRFAFSFETSSFFHTNDPDTLSIRSQKIVPIDKIQTGRKKRVK